MVETTIVIGDSDAPAGKLDVDLSCHKSRPEMSQNSVEESAQRSIYRSSIELARAFVEAPSPPVCPSALSTVRSPEFYHRQLTVALQEYDEAKRRINAITWPLGVPQPVLEEYGRAASVIGALVAEAAALGAIKEDRDKQIKARRNRSANAKYQNEQRAPINDLEQRIRKSARAIVGHEGMSKGSILRRLRGSELRAELDGMSESTFNRMLGPEFGIRKKSRKISRKH